MPLNSGHHSFLLPQPSSLRSPSPVESQKLRAPGVLTAHLFPDPSPKRVSALCFPLVSFVKSNEESSRNVLEAFYNMEGLNARRNVFL